RLTIPTPELIEKSIKICQELADPPLGKYPNIYALILLYRAHISLLGKDAFISLSIKNYDSYSRLLKYPYKFVYLAVRYIAIAANNHNEKAIIQLKKLLELLTNNKRIKGLFFIRLELEIEKNETSDSFVSDLYKICKKNLDSESISSISTEII